MRLHHEITNAVAPFAASSGTAAAFVGAEIMAETVEWVENFVPFSSGENYLPHVTAGVATEAFSKRMKAAPFENFTFSPYGLAVFQIGNFGTAAKKLWEFTDAA